MSTPTDPSAAIAQRFIDAIAAAYPHLDRAAIDPLVAPSRQPQHGDYQCNAAMGLAKGLGLKPRDVAAALIARVRLDDLAEPLTEGSIAGPGFVNIRLRTDALGSMLAALDTPHLGLPPAAERQTVVVDLMGVNLAKQMHVGHLRSPIIGDALARTLERQGHAVIRQNHVGDWGLNIAMVTARLLRQSRTEGLKLDSLTLDALDAAYKAAQAECQRDLDGLAAARRFGLGPKAIAELEEQVAGATEAFLDARAVLTRLQGGDPAIRAVWQRIADVTMSACLAACRRMNVNVTAEHSAGESSYADELAPMVEDLQARGVAELDQGALIVRLDNPPVHDGRPLWEPIKEPCLIRKTDGGFLYATTDIAAIRRRVRVLHAHRLVYAIDARQSLHMKQVFAAAIKAGYATHPQTRRVVDMRHAAFGTILGEDGKPFKTRSGESAKLADLLDEMASRAAAAVRARTPELPDADVARAAEAIGMAALKYADLSQDRIKDYVFSFDRMLAFEGNTGPYLLYALVRIRSIFRKAREKGIAHDPAAPLHLGHPAERQLALAMLRYPAAIAAVAESLEPHRLCTYAYELAGAFNAFFENCPVLAAEDEPTRRSRLRLADLAARVIEDALHTLGIATIDRM